MKTRQHFSIFTALLLLACGLSFPANAQQPAQEAELEAISRQMEAELGALQQLNQEMEILLQEMQALDEMMEESGFSDAFERYQNGLSTCSPVVLTDFPFLGATEIIRGWEGDHCRVDSRITLDGETRASSCLYTRSDIALITGPELYFPEDLERTCQPLLK